MKLSTGRGWAGILASLAMVWLLSGCATHKIDWALRVGNYTYDQAVRELGPPDKQARLNDGSMVAEWVVNRGYTYAYGPAPYAGFPWGGYYSGYVNTYTAPDYWLRLSFDPNGKLSSWKHYYK